MERRILELRFDAVTPEVGVWLAALEDARRDTHETLEGLRDDELRFVPPGDENSLGSLLYHLALIEADWLVDDVQRVVLDQSELAPLFPLSDRDDGGRLTVVDGGSVEEHLERLAAVRQALIAVFRPMTREDFHTPRARAAYDVSPAWVLHHLLQHEAEHRSEIAWVRRSVEHER